jgi:hypothetical protein
MVRRYFIPRHPKTMKRNPKRILKGLELLLAINTIVNTLNFVANLL